MFTFCFESLSSSTPGPLEAMGTGWPLPPADQRRNRQKKRPAQNFFNFFSGYPGASAALIGDAHGLAFHEQYQADIESLKSVRAQHPARISDPWADLQPFRPK
ncbi:hypothetical protein [Tardiphaga sp.]|jgi:hypothetical protein|uniref:hypothetical protein n=1 Tax=Tardiphaga sp. TaxID=1926292 RepID=UPI0037DA7951